MIKHGKGQAQRFVINMDKTKLSKPEVIGQINQVFTSNWTAFVEEGLLIRDDAVIFTKTTNKKRAPAPLPGRLSPTRKGPCALLLITL